MAAPKAKDDAKRDAAESLLARHEQPGEASPWADRAREAAQARLLEMGAPGRRDEYWKFTNPAPLVEDLADAAAPAADDAPVFGEADALRLVFVDGGFRPDLSDDPSLDGVEIQPLADALSADIHWAKDLFGVLETVGQKPVPRPLAALNTARAVEGFAIRVTGKPARPISLRYLREAGRAEAMVRHVIRVDAGGAVTLLEDGPGAARLNMAAEIDVAEGGVCHHVRVQGRDHDRRAATHVFARLGAKSVFKSFTLTMNGRLTRNESVVEFSGEGGVGHIAGAAIGEGEFLHDDTVFVTHDALNCESRQVFKKVLKKGARGVFQGKILVKKDAQKTDGYQISQGLLLDDDAEFDTKPELEIYADDVACSHGATVGAVDEVALFYLRSRGVPEAAAKDMMVIAFVDEAVQEIEDDALADVVRAHIGSWLARRAG